MSNSHARILIPSKMQYRTVIDAEGSKNWANVAQNGQYLYFRTAPNGAVRSGRENRDFHCQQRRLS